MPNIQQRYKNEVVPALMKEFNFSTVMRVPRVQKIVLNIGAGNAIDNPKILDGAVADLQLITGQKPVLTKARKSIANFKLREGRQIGVKVTLRGARMWAFLDRLCNVALPRIRDFRGIPSKGFDGRGNFTLGLREQLGLPGNSVRQDRHAARHGDHDRDDSSKRCRRPPPAGAARHAVQERLRYGEDVHYPSREQPEVRHSRAPSLPRLRPPARLHAPFRYVPHLLP